MYSISRLASRTGGVTRLMLWQVGVHLLAEQSRELPIHVLLTSFVVFSSEVFCRSAGSGLSSSAPPLIPYYRSLAYMRKLSVSIGQPCSGRRMERKQAARKRPTSSRAKSERHPIQQTGNRNSRVSLLENALEDHSFVSQGFPEVDRYRE
jgi:hypothetical protein